MKKRNECVGGVVFMVLEYQSIGIDIPYYNIDYSHRLIGCELGKNYFN